jgi:hypothetical protein
MLEANTDLAIAFLRSFRRKVRYDLIAIDPESGCIEAATFLLTETDKMRAWIEERQGRMNLYYTFNEVRADAPKNKKPSKRDIGWIVGVSVDLDPAKVKEGDPTGENFRKERDRLTALAMKIGKEEECRPMLMVDSGGGFQPFWLLKNPIEADESNIELIEGIGRTLQRRYGGDSTWNIDRVLRILGTINLPDKGKQAQGRVPALATVLIEASSEESYTLDQLSAWAPSTAAKAKTSADTKLPAIDMSVVRSAVEYDDLPADLRTRFQSACNQDPTLRDLWEGKPAPRQKDETGSGFAFALASALKATNKFTAQEFGQLLWIWPHSPDQDKIDDRYIGRTWARAMPRIESSDGFDPVCIEDREQRLIRIQPGLDKLATQGEQALIATGAPIYVHAEMLQRPVVDEVAASKGRKTKVARFAPVTMDAMRDHLSRAARWGKFNERKKAFVPTDPPRDVASVILSRVGEWTFPRAVGIITTQTLRPDGTILSQPGYDPTTRLILVDPPPMPTIPEKPTRDDALAALSLLDLLLEEFPFVDAASRSVALSELITPVVRGAMSTAPMHVNRAPTPGSGKSYILDIAATISSGQSCPVISAGADEFETEKRLGAALLQGQAMVAIDNVNSELRGDALCQMLDRPLVAVRPLGISRLVPIESRSTVFATGNNIRVAGDLVRRVLICSLNPDMERPELRKFNSNPVETVLNSRGRYIAACLTVVRAYLAAGCPNTLPPLASFEDWSRLVRSALVWLGRADPVTTMEAARAEDPELDAIRRVLAAWQHDVGLDRQCTAGELKALAEASDMNGLVRPDLNAALVSVAPNGDEINTRKLGHWLSRHRDRMIGEYKLIGREDGHSKQTVWSVTRIGPPRQSDEIFEAPIEELCS